LESQMNPSAGRQNVTSLPSSEELENRLLCALGMPGSTAWGRGAPSAAANLKGVDLRKLNKLILELQRDATLIGTIPQNYPRHIDLMMKGVSALLPWYTRPLREHGKKTSRAIAALAEVVNQLVLRQQEFEESVRNRPQNATEGRPHIP
jgi:hypothetical protein